MTTIAENLNRIRRRISEAAVIGGRSPESIRLVAVSKTVEAARVREAVAAGARILGENYIQEAREKIQSLSDLPVSWHFIGHLQTNKAKYAVRLFDLIHSVDSIRLARALDREAAKLGKRQQVLVQVNVAGEAKKSGTDPKEADALVGEIAGLENLSVQGLMTLPPFFDDPERARPYFRELRALRDRIAERLPAVALAELSMGMTGDFEAAVAEGATLVRIGTALFGVRR